MTAGATAPLGYFADRFTAGLGGLGTKKAGEEIIKELSARQVAAKVGKRAAVGASAGVIAEAPLEVLEQAAERWQAGLSLTGDDAANEYKEAFFGAAAAGAGIGGASRAIQAYQTPVKPGTTETSKGPSEDEQRARFAFLNAISSGTKDQVTVDENGKQVKIPGQLGRFFTPEEQAEYQKLKQKLAPETTPPPAPPAPPTTDAATEALLASTIDPVTGQFVQQFAAPSATETPVIAEADKQAAIKQITDLETDNAKIQAKLAAGEYKVPKAIANAQAKLAKQQALIDELKIRVGDQNVIQPTDTGTSGDGTELSGEPRGDIPADGTTGVGLGRAGARLLLLCVSSLGLCCRWFSSP
jgi:hypothetical protein